MPPREIATQGHTDSTDTHTYKMMVPIVAGSADGELRAKMTTDEASDNENDGHRKENIVKSRREETNWSQWCQGNLLPVHFVRTRGTTNSAGGGRPDGRDK